MYECRSTVSSLLSRSHTVSTFLFTSRVSARHLDPHPEGRHYAWMVYTFATQHSLHAVLVHRSLHPSITIQSVSIVSHLPPPLSPPMRRQPSGSHQARYPPSIGNASHSRMVWTTTVMCLPHGWAMPARAGRYKRRMPIASPRSPTHTHALPVITISAATRMEQRQCHGALLLARRRDGLIVTSHPPSHPAPHDCT